MKHFFAHASLLVLLMMATTVMAQPVASPHGEMTVDCRTCHADESWESGDGPIAFDHDATGFPLRGVHIGVACEFCHESLEFSQIGVMCADCHTDAHQGSLGFDCEECHDERGWENRTLMRDRHDTTAFPLRGAHSQTDCNACHTGPIETTYAMTPTDCYACHANEYQATTSPEHASLGYDHDCTMCHDPFGSGWTGQRFLHPTSFPLSGAHALTNCTNCHTDDLTALPTECVACHQTDYDAALEPDHIAAEFDLDCAGCHGTRDWIPAAYDHIVTGFPLTGTHVSTSCSACHTDGYTNTPNDCVACHQSDYDTSTDPEHLSAGFPTDCASCHGTIAWTPADFDHNATAFALTGAHTTALCVSCHADGYTNTPTECNACHQVEYDATTDPGHLAAGFPVTCADCHSTSAWTPADFDHNASAFPLTGAHISTLCASCHTDGYAGTPTDCDACHQAEYDATTDPGHTASGFPVTCADCHSTNDWVPANWDHDSLFPIYSGKHDGEWDNCVDCHLTPTDYAHFECIFCHEHNNQTDVDNDHDEERDYEYLSTACLECHPEGDE